MLSEVLCVVFMAGCLRNCGCRSMTGDVAVLFVIGFSRRSNMLDCSCSGSEVSVCLSV